MTEQEMLEELKTMISPDEAEEKVLKSLLRRAGDIVLNKRYPFGYESGTKVPDRYQGVQLEIALELYAKTGVEGQTSHGEGDTSRTYESAGISKSLLSRIVPLAGTVAKTKA